VRERSQVLLLGYGREHDELAGRVVLLGYRTLRAADVETAVTLIRRQTQPVRALMFPPEAPLARRAEDLQALAEAAGPLELGTIVCGIRPEIAELAALKRDGARFCLWRPFNDSELRFVINSALHDSSRADARPNTRVPTNLVARVKAGAGEKPGVLYNLSATGAFVETLRPNLPGGRILLTIEFSDGSVPIDGSVVFANVPGNLQRPNLPIGMGIKFAAITPAQRERVAKYVAERVRAYEL
jgi:hypothetical protein